MSSRTRVPASVLWSQWENAGAGQTNKNVSLRGGGKKKIHRERPKRAGLNGNFSRALTFLRETPRFCAIHGGETLRAKIREEKSIHPLLRIDDFSG